MNIHTVSLLTILAFAPSMAAEAAKVEFVHYKSEFDATTISAKPGEEIVITIKSTFPDAFDYEIGGIKLTTPSQPSGARGPSVELKDLTDKVFKQKHDKQYGGYFVRITKKEPGPVSVKTSATTTEPLEEKTFIISVDTVSWDVAFAGGFTISDLTSPVYASQSQMDSMGMTQNVVFRDFAAEDDKTLGLAGLIHVYHESRPHWAWSFGLAIGDSNETSYMAGPTYRFGEKAAITAGYMWAPIDTLPPGTIIGDTLDNPNALANLGTKTDSSWFLSFSYSFIPGISDVFKKQFRGETSGGSAPTSVAKPESPDNADTDNSEPFPGDNSQ